MKDTIVGIAGFVLLVVLVVGFVGGFIWLLIWGSETEKRQLIACEEQGKVLVLYRDDPHCVDFEQLGRIEEEKD